MSIPALPGSVTYAPRLSDAALIATFYFQAHQPTETFAQQLARGLHLLKKAPQVWASDDYETHVRYYTMNRPHTDTSVIQLTFNRRGDVDAQGQTWVALRRQIDANLEVKEFTTVRGYSLIYQAELAEDDSVDTVVAAVLPVLQRLHAPDQVLPLRPLAQTSIDGGYLWLLHIPRTNDGPQAATIYLALSRPDPENRFVKQVLLGSQALLLLPDLIAHKGYHQLRQYDANDLMQTYSQRVEEMRDATGRLLNIVDEQHTDKALSTMIPQYDRLVEAILWLQGLRISLTQQIENYRLLPQYNGDNVVFQFHLQQLDVGGRDLDLLVSKGKTVLDVAGTTLHVRRARLEELAARRQEARQQQLHMVIGMVGLGLAMSQLIDKAVVADLLALIGVPAPATEYPVLLLFLVQTGLILVLVIAAAALWRRIIAWRGQRKSPV